MDVLCECEYYLNFKVNVQNNYTFYYSLEFIVFKLNALFFLFRELKCVMLSRASI